MAEYGTVIYRRGSKSSGTVSDAVSDDMWDDKILIDLYDKALNVAQEEVAKRLAMKTNSNEGGSSKKKTKNKIEPDKNVSIRRKPWKVGSECRAIFSEDGLEYEATIVKINGDDCTVVYLGYDNEEDIQLSKLKPSLGKYHRMRQSMEAGECEPYDIKQHLNNELTKLNKSDYLYSSEDTRTQQKLKTLKSKHIKASKNKYPNVELPQIPSFLSSPFLPSLNFDSQMPLPPPPFLPSMSSVASGEDEDQTLSTMLISWYMSGYYTGLYQGQKMARKKN